MKLFKLEIVRARQGRDVVAHAESEDVARRHVGSKFTGWQIRNCIELLGAPMHFVIAEWEAD